MKVIRIYEDEIGYGVGGKWNYVVNCVLEYDVEFGGKKSFINVSGFVWFDVEDGDFVVVLERVAKFDYVIVVRIRDDGLIVFF